MSVITGPYRVPVPYPHPFPCHWEIRCRGCGRIWQHLRRATAGEIAARVRAGHDCDKEGL